MEDEMAITGTLCLGKVNKSTLFEGFWCLTPLRVGHFFRKRQQPQSLYICYISDLVPHFQLYNDKYKHT
jgi:hypothetical protein